MAKTISVKDKSYYGIDSKKPDYLKIVGIWSDEEAEGVRKEIKKFRKENKRLSEARMKRLGFA